MLFYATLDRAWLEKGDSPQLFRASNSWGFCQAALFSHVNLPGLGLATLKQDDQSASDTLISLHLKLD